MLTRSHVGDHFNGGHGRRAAAGRVSSDDGMQLAKQFNRGMSETSRLEQPFTWVIIQLARRQHHF